MSFVVALLAAAVLLYVWRARRKSPDHDVARETTAPLEAFVVASLEAVLAGPVLGLAGASADERASLAKTLRHEPDPEIVSKIEAAVREVELCFVRYSHEADAEVTVRVRFESGDTGERSRRLSMSDLPEPVRAEFEERHVTRVFRAWTFPWQRVQAL